MHFKCGLDENGNPAVYVPRILDIPEGQLCYLIGTVYVDMPLKPNVLNDIAQEVGLQMLWLQQMLTTRLPDLDG
jgi:hypothetical protein